MSKQPFRISAISYVNTKPFVYGIQHSEYLSDYSLSFDIPSVCAEKLKNNQVDIGIAPVAILHELKEYFIVPDFCIGANGTVRTVVLHSDVPLEEIKSIHLDNHSRTSSLLVQVLAKYWWKISPVWIPAKEGYEDEIHDSTAGIIIGDRNFSILGKHPYTYDLAEVWKAFTDLPFVFACWISNKKLDEQTALAFYKALKYGVDHREEVIRELKDRYNESTIKEYLYNKINYHFDKPKQEAMALYLKLSREFIIDSVLEKAI